MNKKITVLKNWVSETFEHLGDFDPIISQEPEFGPIIHTDYCWIYMKPKGLAVHNKKDNKVRYYPGVKGVVFDVVIRFGGFNKERKKKK